MEDWTLYHDTFEPSLSTSIYARDKSPKAPILPQHRDDIKSIVDDYFITSTTSITQYFLFKWHDRLTSDVTWINLEELYDFALDLLN